MISSRRQPLWGITCSYVRSGNHNLKLDRCPVNAPRLRIGKIADIQLTGVVWLRWPCLDS